MSPELLATLVSAIVALTAAGFTVWGQTRNARLEAQLRREDEEEKHKREAARLISRYREPLIHAAFDLQSRIFNLLELQIINLHYTQGDERSRRYVVDNTAFLIAQYFGWTEILRQEGLFLDLGETEKNRLLNELQDKITHAWLRDDLGLQLCIFKGNQRIIGEQMIKEGPDGKNCFTYGDFISALDDPGKEYLTVLKQDVAGALENIDLSRSRLTLLQNVLIDLIDFLDPSFVRFPANRRSKLQS